MKEGVEKVSVDELITDGGYRYIQNEEGLKVRNSLVGQRLKEDGETFEEYKLRQKFITDFHKNYKKGTWFWKSEKAPSAKLQVMMAMDPKGTIESPEFKEHSGNNMGTYDKKKVEEFLKSRVNG